jgi:hypothetical protein
MFFLSICYYLHHTQCMKYFPLFCCPWPKYACAATYIYIHELAADFCTCNYQTMKQHDNKKSFYIISWLIVAICCHGSLGFMRWYRKIKMPRNSFLTHVLFVKNKMHWNHWRSGARWLQRDVACGGSCTVQSQRYVCESNLIVLNYNHQ